MSMIAELKMAKVLAWSWSMFPPTNQSATTIHAIRQHHWIKYNNRSTREPITASDSVSNINKCVGSSIAFVLSGQSCRIPRLWQGIIPNIYCVDWLHVNNI